MYLDVIKILDECKIAYSRSGKNIGRGWVGIRSCPFCGDKNYHMGIHKKTANVHCWKCKTKGWIYDYLMEEFKCDRRKAREICKPYMSDRVGFSEELLTKVTRTKLPEEASKNFPKCHIKYLNSRGFSYETIQRFDLYSIFMESKYSYRIVIPIKYDDTLVAFTTRAISKVMEPRYLHSPNDISVIPVKQTVYNIDMMTDHVIICEGPTDVWKMGTSCIATFGVEFTNRQLNMIRKKGVKKATILYDPGKGGTRSGKELNTALDFIGIESEIYTLKDKDPGELSETEVQDIRKEIFKRR